MTKTIFLSLPVTDLAVSTRFYEAIGCVKNPDYSNDDGSSMMWSDQIIFMLMKREYLATFTTRPIAPAHGPVAMAIALSLDSREAVDAMAHTAAANGGRIVEITDHGFMYQHAFEDPDGHHFEPTWMDPNAAQPTEG